MAKKIINKNSMLFSVMTKNLNWEISTKNLVTFKRWDDGSLILWEFFEKSNFGGSGGRGGVVNRLKRGLG